MGLRNFTYKWIEGEKELDGFMEKFSPNENIQWRETIGYHSKFKAYHVYKDADNDMGYADMYLLWMPIESGNNATNVIDEYKFDEILKMTYEQIKANRTTGRVRRR